MPLRLVSIHGVVVLLGHLEQVAVPRDPCAVHQDLGGPPAEPVDKQLLRQSDIASALPLSVSVILSVTLHLLLHDLLRRVLDGLQRGDVHGDLPGGEEAASVQNLCEENMQNVRKTVRDCLDGKMRGNLLAW